MSWELDSSSHAISACPTTQRLFSSILRGVVFSFTITIVEVVLIHGPLRTGLMSYGEGVLRMRRKLAAEPPEAQDVERGQAQDPRSKADRKPEKGTKRYAHRLQGDAKASTSAPKSSSASEKRWANASPSGGRAATRTARVQPNLAAEPTPTSVRVATFEQTHELLSARDSRIISNIVLVDVFEVLAQM